MRHVLIINPASDPANFLLVASINGCSEIARGLPRALEAYAPTDAAYPYVVSEPIPEPEPDPQD